MYDNAVQMSIGLYNEYEWQGRVVQNGIKQLNNTIWDTILFSVFSNVCDKVFKISESMT